MPFSVHSIVDHPLSLYAATKRANELMAHNYSRAVQAADHGPALLHGVRAVGPARHGAVHVHAQHPRGQADRRVQPRPPHARLHLRRRHRRGRGARLRARCRSPNPAWDSDAPDPATSSAPFRALQHRQQPAGAAAALHRGASRSASGARRRRTCCRCSPATYPTPSPTSTTWCGTWATVPRTPIEVGVRNFVDWFCEYYGYQR